MKIFKFNKRVEINKSIGTLKLQTFHYGNWDKNGKHYTYSELHLWNDNKCDECPCGWESRSYEGECDCCGCWLAKRGHEEASTWICLLPNWIKGIAVKIKEHRYEKSMY